jgi:hypothetical protein
LVVVERVVEAQHQAQLILVLVAEQQVVDNQPLLQHHMEFLVVKVVAEVHILLQTQTLMETFGVAEE